MAFLSDFHPVSCSKEFLPESFMGLLSQGFSSPFKRLCQPRSKLVSHPTIPRGILIKTWTLTTLVAVGKVFLPGGNDGVEACASSAASFQEASSSPGNPLVACLALSVICEHQLKLMEKKLLVRQNSPSQLPESLVSHSSPYLPFINPLKVLLKPPYSFLRQPWFHLVLWSREVPISVSPSGYFLCFYVKLIDYFVTSEF